MSNKARIYYWDNLKSFLIFLVCLGHFLIPIHQNYGQITETIYYFIYMFHMPAFVFVSGYFAKNFIEHGKKDKFTQTRTLLAYLILYVLFIYALQLISFAITKEWKTPSLLHIETAPWYLLCMFLWLLILQIYEQFDWKVAIPVSLIFALLFNINVKTGTFLSLSRCVAFFPFFLIGYYVQWDTVKKLLTVRNKIIATIVLIGTIVFVWMYVDKIGKYSTILLASHSYASVPTTVPKAIGLRIGWIGLASIITICVMILTPQKKLFISKIGQNSLGVYIFHRLAREAFQKLHFYDHISDNELVVILICIAISLLCCVLFGGDRLNKVLRLPFKINYSHMRNKKA